MSSFRAVVRESGFFLPESPAGGDTMDGGAFRLMRVGGLEQPLQYFRVGLVSGAEIVDDVLVVCAHHPRLDDDALAVISPGLPDAVFMRETEPGFASGSCRSSTTQAAAALATVLVVAAWDESERIIVELDGVRHHVTMRFENDGWLASVEVSASSAS